MKYSAAILALAAAVAAQSISDLPSCSIQCVANGVTGVGCGLTDFACSCGKADQLTPAVTPCVQKACSSTADQQKVITVLQGICAAAGHPITIPTPAASSAAQQPSSPATSAAAENSKPAASSSAAPTIQTSVPAPQASDVCSVTTITETVTAGVPKTPSAPSAPYPTAPAPYPSAPAGTGGVPQPSGTGAITSSAPLFTGAASPMKVPAAAAGLMGLAAYLL